MTAQEYSQAIEWYLGYDPKEDVKKHSYKENGEFQFKITEWDVPEKEPTLEQLETVYNDNITAHELEQAKASKEKEVIEKVKDKLIKADQEYIDKKALIDSANTLEDLEAIN